MAKLVIHGGFEHFAGAGAACLWGYNLVLVATGLRRGHRVIATL